MDRITFAERFAAAATDARDLARRFVIEELPAELRFRVRLNQSYGETHFPDDSDAGLGRVDLATAVAALWRDGHVPEWVNVSVVSVTATTTLIEAICAGRFTDRDVAPFHVVGPALPPWPDHSGRFSLYLRAECRDAEDLAQLVRNADRVWSLDLHTPLDQVPALPNAEILEHPASTWAGYRRFPRLRHLRLHLSGTGDFRLGGPPLAELLGLKITGLPGRPWGQAALPPNVEELDLRGAEQLWLEDAWPAGIRRLTLRGDRIAGPARLPARLESLVLSGGDHSALLAGVRVLGSLTLRGTPVTDEVLPALGRLALTGLDVVGTRITPAALARFRDDHPAVDVLPRLPGTGYTDPAYAEAAISLREKRRTEDTHE